MSQPSVVCLNNLRSAGVGIVGVRSAGVGIASVRSAGIGRRSREARRRRASLLVLIIVQRWCFLKIKIWCMDISIHSHSRIWIFTKHSLHLTNALNAPCLIMLFSIVILAAPAVVSVQVMSADSITVSWSPAPTASNVSVTYYINASSPTYQAMTRSVTNPDREVVISGLHPFAEYYITVQAGNPGGLSEPTGRSATTLTAGEYYPNCTIQQLICVPL